MTQTCTEWGDPINLNPNMAEGVHTLLTSSNGRPVTAQGPDDTIYLLAQENGTETARPCTAMGTLGAAPAGYPPYKAKAAGTVGGYNCGCKHSAALAPAQGVRVVNDGLPPTVQRPVLTIISAGVSQGSLLAPTPASPLYYFVYVLTPGGWVPTGASWVPLDQAQDQMIAAIVAVPDRIFGAYVWDGQTMSWKNL